MTMLVDQLGGEGLQGRGRSPFTCGACLPVNPRISLGIRQATMDDLAWIDELQKLHNKMLGFMPHAQLKGYVDAGHVLVAEEIHHGVHGEHGEELNGFGSESGQSNPASVPSVSSVVKSPLGYVIAKDRYFKRDDVGVIFQLNVAPGNQRKLIGASLVKAVFERAAYGCRLFCCWCAQDIAANHFWESIGFVPLAFRTGGRGRGARVGNPCHRIHIFWQRRVREGDAETPYWFPCQTGAGAIREDRLVFPIPPDCHWSDAKPIILPGCQRADAEEGRPLLCNSSPRERNKRTPAVKAVRPAGRPRGGLWFAPQAVISSASLPAPAPAPAERRGKLKNDPRHVAMARELRDRYLEAINSERLLPPAAHGKYDVSRQLEAALLNLTPAMPLLKAG